MPQKANRCMVLWLGRPIAVGILVYSGQMAELLARWCFHEQDVSGRDCGRCWQGCQQDGRRGSAQHGAVLWGFTSLPGAAWHWDPRGCPRSARAAAAHACAAAQEAFGRHNTLHGLDYCSRRASARSALLAPGAEDDTCDPRGAFDVHDMAAFKFSLPHHQRASNNCQHKIGKGLIMRGCQSRL